MRYNSNVVLTYNTLMAKGVEHYFIYVWAICVSSSMYCLFILLTNLSHGFMWVYAHIQLTEHYHTYNLKHCFSGTIQFTLLYDSPMAWNPPCRLDRLTDKP